MARYFLTSQTLQLICGKVHVEMFSKPDEHLWLLWTTRYPRMIESADRRQPQTKPHHITYQIFIDHQVEQNEPGVTSFHSFDFTWPPGAEVIWFYTVNANTNPKKPSRSPIYVYKFSPANGHTEPFATPTLNPDFNWQGSIDPFGGSASVSDGHYSGSIAYPPGNNGSTIHISAATTPWLFNTNPCDTTVQFTINSAAVGTYYSAGGILIEIVDTFGGDKHDIFFQAGAGSDEAHYNPMTGPNTGYLSLGTGTFSYTLRQLLTLSPTSPGGWTPAPSGNYYILGIGYQMPQGVPLTATAGFDFGPLSVFSSTVTFQDISLIWKPFRIHPILP